MIRTLTQASRFVPPALLLCLLTACGSAEQNGATEVLRPVKIFEVTQNNQARQRTFSGLSQSSQESRLSFKVGGTIIELPIQVGDALQPGQLIARLDASSYELEAEQARASLVQAQANQRNAESSYERIKNLYENSNASLNDLDNARATAESAEAEVKAVQKALEIAQLNQSYTSLTASRACVVANLPVQLNENVKSGDEIARVNCGDDIEVKIGVPEGLIAQIDSNTPTTAQFSAIANRQFAARITEIGAASDEATTTFPVVVQLTEADPRLRPSMAAQVTLQFNNGGSQSQSIYIVPAAAVANDQNGTFVFLATPVADGTAQIQRRAVELGELTASGIEVVSGLNNGDLLVSAGVTVVRDQQTVLLP